MRPDNGSPSNITVRMKNLAIVVFIVIAKLGSKSTRLEALPYIRYPAFGIMKAKIFAPAIEDLGLSKKYTPSSSHLQ
jgi:hypothetical protein